MSEFLRCLLLPIGQESLLLPYSAVAEIIEMELKLDNEPKLESVTWRGIKLSLVHLEPRKNPFSLRQNIAVLNRAADVSKDFVGLVLSAVPSMYRFKRSDIEWVDSPLAPYALMNVTVRTLPAIIPNLLALE